jgi:hypothetical protein
VRIEVGVHKGGKRPELRALFGSIMVFADEAEIRLESDLGRLRRLWFEPPEGQQIMW